MRPFQALHHQVRPGPDKAAQAACALLQTRALQCTVGERTIIAPSDITFEPGITAVLGPNGSGKSSLLRTLAGLAMRPMHLHGEVLYQGTSLHAMRRAERAATLAWLGQDAASGAGDQETSGLNIEGLVRMAALARQGLWPPGWWRPVGSGDRSAGKDHCIRQAMDDFDLRALAGKALSSVSGGELQRAHLARVFAVDSPVLLLDEPDNHLDLRHQAGLKSLMHARAGRGHVVVFSTHDLNAAMNADRLLVLDQGKLALNTRLAEIDDDDLCKTLSDIFASRLSLIRHQGHRLFVQA